MISVGQLERVALILGLLVSGGECGRSKRFLCLSGVVCYDEPIDVGCFDRVAFGRFCQHGVLPADPVSIDPNFTIAHSDEPYSYHHINIVNLTDQVARTRFPKGNDVTFIIHGFGESEKQWMHYAQDAILHLDHQTVVLVYWGRGSTHPNYFQAAANTRVVGVIIARMIEAINQIHGIPLSRVRLVGFSLGAHVAGFAGKQFNETRIGSIYGLDPAGPLFTAGNPNRFYKPVPAEERLDRNDADYVEVLHTSGDDFMYAGAGSPFQFGDVDFYANGGEHQPGCQIEYYKFFTFDTENMNGLHLQDLLSSASVQTVSYGHVYVSSGV
uniref:Lipase domain-containing protein n=1 Tax=Steinernema glaseri TaxID=37863 RepID=A0A1I8AM64_9BILA